MQDALSFSCVLDFVSGHCHDDEPRRCANGGALKNH